MAQGSGRLHNGFLRVGPTSRKFLLGTTHLASDSSIYGLIFWLKTTPGEEDAVEISDSRLNQLLSSKDDLQISKNDL